MQAQAYEGYFESGKFYTAGKHLRIPERRKVYITILDETLQVSQPLASQDWLMELHRLLDESSEETLDINDFPRMDFGRETIILSDEG
ncbi:MAG: hypothetical protein FWE42_00260 [Defluviitaleaceae bacterium]|nr:hypothetical protein [Defluviitaleaceae bacterium]